MKLARGGRSGVRSPSLPRTADRSAAQLTLTICVNPSTRLGCFQAPRCPPLGWEGGALKPTPSCNVEVRDPRTTLP